MNNDNTRSCANCKYWCRNGESKQAYNEKIGDYEDLPHKRCVRIIHGNGYNGHDCNAMNEPAAVFDGSGYSASLYTMPSFSCSLFTLQVEE